MPIIEAFLQKYYRPTDKYNGFYTPFKTSNTKKRWNTFQYANTLHRITVDTFADVILHPKNTREWGWKTDYIRNLAEEHLTISLIPTLDLAVWLFRARNWSANTGVDNVIETFFSEFHIDQKEHVLFSTAVRLPNDKLLLPVPIILCSAGIKRIVALAYILVWAWNEHIINSELIREKPQRSIVLLIDEMEAHLHPFWQRAIVPAVMKVVQALAEEVSTQVMIATHSPLILASIEPIFDEDQDSLFHLYLDIDNGSVQLNEVPFVMWEILKNRVVAKTDQKTIDGETHFC